jgi:hypothetical protein
VGELRVFCGIVFTNALIICGSSRVTNESALDTRQVDLDTVQEACRASAADYTRQR